MAVSNRDRVGRALELLQAGLRPFVDREMKAKNGDGWLDKARQELGDTPTARNATSVETLDAAALLVLVVANWQYVFRYKLGKAERSLVGELQEVRNSWAHQKPFSLDDTNRALDSVKRLLLAVNATQAEEVDAQLQEVLRQKFDEMTRREVKKAATGAVEGKFTTGLPPWRDVITPHADVASGNYMVAEFAADLWQVYQDQFDRKHKAPAEYTDPVEFFRRTFLTGGLSDLLTLGVRRVVGQAADPVVKLQTNFGGGKTHSMLGLYHLFGGVAPARLAGVEALLKDARVASLPRVNRAVLVGNKLSLTGFKKPDGLLVRTMWGELAWQLGQSAGRAREAYEMVRADDEAGVCPSRLVDLLRAFSPCVVLIDEWVAFVRQLYGTPGLPAGTFDANITFAQSLTEAFKAAPGAFLVASLPASDIEIGGDGGREALKRLENTFDRVQSTWRPATTDECFEIVRRRLFQPLEGDKFALRDAVARAFGDMYRSEGDNFPAECKEAAYERRIQSSYPIHPELFDRLFQDWSTLERFQKTRGVLRLMAAVIHALWERQDANLLILPATVPMDRDEVKNELTRYMDDQWTPVIEKDVDHESSMSLKIDRENPTFGRLSAARRVARTLYLGSAPSSGPNRGIDDRRIKLGCVQPGEPAAVFGDALRRLSDRATHVYVDQSRYWLGIQPSVTRTAQERAEQLERARDSVLEEIRRLLRQEQSSRGDFAKVYPCPASSGDVPDELETRLVILSPEQAHTAKATDSPAMVAAKEMLEQRGGSPRLYRNALVFLAADRTRLMELEAAVRSHLAWESIERDAEALNLDAFQRKLVATKCRETQETVRRRLPETYHWLLVAGQSSPQSPVEWQESRLQGDERLALRASKKLINGGSLAARFGGPLLRGQLDQVPLWRGEHVSVKQLIEDFAQYPYLQRLRGPEVLLEAVRDGVSRLTWMSEGFAYADGVDPKSGRYIGLRTVSITAADVRGVVVKPEVAARQMAAEEAERTGPAGPGGAPGALGGGGAAELGVGTGTAPTGSTAGVAGSDRSVPPPPRRFYGTVDLDPQRVGFHASEIAKEVIVHLQGLAGANVQVRLEIEAEVPQGVEPGVVRTVTENCRVLKFKSQGFEQR